MSLAKKVLIGILAAAVVLSAALVALLNTQAGLIAAKYVLESTMDGFKAGEMTGSPLNLQARGLEYSAPGISFKGNVSWNVSFLDLLYQRGIGLTHFEISDAALRVRSQEMSPAQAQTPAAGAVQAGEAAPTGEKPQDQRLRAPVRLSLGRFTLKNVQADIDGNAVSVGLFEAFGVWHHDNVVLEKVALKDSSFLAAPAQDAGEPLGAVLKRTFAQPVLPAIPAVELPVDFELKAFELSNFTLKGSPDQTIESVRFALAAKDGVLRVNNLDVKTMQAALSGSLSLGLDARHAVTGSLRASAVVAREAIPTGVFPKPKEPTNEEMGNFYERLKDLAQERKEAVAERRAKRKAAGVQRKTVDRSKMTIEERREARRKARARFVKRLEAWRSQVRGLMPKAEPLPPVEVALTLQISGALNDEVSLAGRLENVPGVTDGIFTVKAAPAQTGLPVQAHVGATEVLISGAVLKAPVLEISGRAVDYKLEASTHASYPVDDKHSFTSDVRIKGTGSESQAKLSDFSIKSNAGLLHIDCQADWSTNPGFVASLQLSDIDTTAVMPQAPLKAEGSFVAWGVRKDNVWTAKLQDLTILGEFRGHQLALTGAFETRGNGTLQTPSLYFALGDNSLEAKGTIDIAKEVPVLNFTAGIDAPDFELVDPNLLGSVKGTLAVSGTTSLPVVDADIRLTGIDYLGTTLKKGRLFGRIRSSHAVSGKMTLELTELKTQGAHMKNISVEVRGSELRHTVLIKADGEPASVQAKINGVYGRLLNSWAGTLSEFKVTTAYGPVSLEKPLRTAYVSGLNRFNIGKACLVHPDARVCLKNDLSVDLTNQSDLRILIGLEKFDLAFIEHYFKGRFEARGIVTAQADLTLAAGMADLPSGSLRVQAKNIGTTYRMDLSDLDLGFNALDVTVSNTKDSVSAQWLIDIVDNGDISGNLNVRDIFDTRAIDGNLMLKAIDASLVNSFLSPGEKAEGEIFGGLRFAGTIDEPQVFGETGIRGAKLDSTKLPFEMLPSNITVDFNGNNSTMKGLFRTPKGEIQLNGSADWRTLAEGRTIVSAKGANLQVTLPPNIQFDLSTDVTCEASAEKIKLDGLIAIPKARVLVSELPPSTVEVSDDVVRMDRPRPKKKDNAQTIPIESNLFINIGENVWVSAMGLDARLTGELHVVQDKSSLGLTGHVSVPVGSFKAYGQDLIVRRGQFLFSGSSTNPLIDLEAIRNPDKTADDVTAGVRVTGSANFPKVSVFCDPEKSETEALSYLIRGEGLDPSGDSDNSMITSALINLGLSQGSQVFRSLGDAVGISGFGVGTEGVGDSSQLVVSGYVLPGLKVKYGVGIFDPLATLTLRYRIIPRLYVEAVSGVDQALDLLYSFEF